MARSTDPQCKQCRREGEKLFLKGERCTTPKCAMVRRAYAPGDHGEKGGRPTQYGKQLRAKQKVKRIYGVLERQFRRYYDAATSQDGVTGDLLLEKLERRLDNVIYRLGMASSRRQARQLVSHAEFTVNGNKVSIPSFIVSPGDVIAIKEEKKNKKYFTELAKKITDKNIPAWLSLDPKEMKAEILTNPTKNDVDLSMDMQLIVELYSR